MLSSGHQYELSIEETPYARKQDEEADDGSRWGIDGGFSRTYLTKFTLTVDGQHVWIPRKVYEDLPYISLADAYDFGGALRVDLKGGDAAGSFRASFLFSGWRIERFDYHGEFPKSRWEYIVETASVSEVTDGDSPPLPHSDLSLNPASSNTDE